MKTVRQQTPKRQFNRCGGHARIAIFCSALWTFGFGGIAAAEGTNLTYATTEDVFETSAATSVIRGVILSRCNAGTDARPVNGVMYQFAADNKDSVLENLKICCPNGQLPTGKTGTSEQKCALAHSKSKRGCNETHARDPLNSVSVCINPTAPFSVCCPTNQIATCEPDISKTQCESVSSTASTLSTLVEVAAFAPTDESVSMMVDESVASLTSFEVQSVETTKAKNILDFYETPLDSERFVMTELELSGANISDAFALEAESSLRDLEDPGPEGFVGLSFPSPAPDLQLCMRLATMSSGMTRPGSETLYYIAAAGACCAATTTVKYTTNVAAICARLTGYRPGSASATALRWKTCVEYASALEPLCSLAAPVAGRIWKVVNGIVPPKIIGPGKIIPGIPPIF